MKAYTPELGETVDDAWIFDAIGSDLDRHNAAYAAEEFYSSRDGWECGWPINLTLVADNGDEKTFRVYREAVPSFYASEVNEKAVTE